MNKIVLDEEYYSLENKSIEIEIKKKNITLEIKGEVLLNDLSTKEDVNLNIILNDNSKLIYNKFNKDLSYENINFEINNNTYLSFNQSTYNTLEGNFKIFANIKGSNNKTYINFYGVTNENGRLIVDATGSVENNIINNDMLENIRILSLNDEENIILPNLLVSSDEVEINHNATISGLNEDYLFYLTAKGFLMNKLELSNEVKENLF